MSEMVERVARVLDGTLYAFSRSANYAESRRKAREIIEAMREPTEAMNKAAWPIGSTQERWLCAENWRDMIDEALK